MKENFKHLSAIYSGKTKFHRRGEDGENFWPKIYDSLNKSKSQ